MRRLSLHALLLSCTVAASLAAMRCIVGVDMRAGAFCLSGADTAHLQQLPETKQQQQNDLL